MKLFKSPVRRSAAIVAGALAGLAGAVAIAAPASAHHPTVVPKSACVNPDGTWQVTWAVANSESDITATLDSVEFGPAGRSTLTGIDTASILPRSGDGPLIGVQTLNEHVQLATLTVQAHWIRLDADNGEPYDIVQVDTGRRVRPQKECEPESPSPSPSIPTPSPSAPEPSESAPAPEPSASESNPPTEPTPTPTESAPAEAQWIYDQTCDTLTVGVDVPADWDDLTVTFTPSTGEAKTVTAPAGKETTVDFPASTGLKVVASAKGFEDETATITYKQPADCDTGGNGGGDDDGGTLPLTGAAAGSIAGGAAVLLALGGLLFFMARRRKVKFTA